MNDLLRRIGTTVRQPSRTRTEEAPPRLRALLREILVEENGMIEAYRELSDTAGQTADDIWSYDWAAPRVRELADNLDWDLVYELLERYAPKPLSGLDAYDSKVNDVLAREGMAYKMVDGKIMPFDPEGEDLELDTTNPIDNEDEAYAPVRRQYQRAIDALNGRPMDPLTAIRESLNALEALGRILTGKPKASLGEIVDKLLGPAVHRRALAAALKALYGYSSTVPGARHGEHETVDIQFAEAAFVVRSAGAAIAMLLAEHRKESTEVN
ncbi:AbiJ-NTD4 domain-containing protein [Agromyces laixinhei]|uniref:AbiJ-NTD4 domain-containing protein n=1 Tax=Agromyces laixinhei TaxID=2585717 RepID=UPI0012EDEBAB|nr:hypothetical protein [Agromyces laixinhei]